MQAGFGRHSLSPKRLTDGFSDQNEIMCKRSEQLQCAYAPQKSFPALRLKRTDRILNYFQMMTKL